MNSQAFDYRKRALVLLCVFFCFSRRRYPRLPRPEEAPSLAQVTDQAEPLFPELR